MINLFGSLPKKSVFSSGDQVLPGKSNERQNGRYLRSFVFLFIFLIISGCSMRRIAINTIANSLSESSSSVFATDDDPELVKEALPFALKTMEALLQSAPENENLLISTAAGFVQYAHAFVVMPANEMEYTNYTSARKQKERAKKLFLRAQKYGLRVLNIRYRDFYDKLILDPFEAVSVTQKKDVPALYWTGAAWASALSMAKDDMSLVGDLPIITALMERALELDEAWHNGALHEFFIAFKGGQSAEDHFNRAMQLNQNRSIGPMVSFAESVCVSQQDYQRFKKLLDEVLAFDVDKYQENRLANILAQQKAAFLLNNMDHLFINLPE